MLALAFLLLPWVPVDAALKAGCKPCPSTGPDGQPLQQSVFLPECVYHEGDRRDGGTETYPSAENKPPRTMTVEECCGCRDVNTSLQLVVKVVDWLFRIVGAVALVIFIYGGFMMLTSAGSEEKVKKGRDALVAAVIGLAIMFSAHLIIRFVLEGALGEASLKLDAGGGLQVDVNK